MNQSIIQLAYLFLFISMSSLADQPRFSRMNIWTENENVYVLHTHKAIAWTLKKSETRIVSKETGKVVFKANTSPFTIIIPVENGKYFAGLSDLQAGSLLHGYNFALFTPSGEFISKVYVSRETGYCEKVKQSVSQYLYWFSRMPDVKLEREHGKISKIVIESPFHDTKPCELPIGEHLVKLENGKY